MTKMDPNEIQVGSENFPIWMPISTQKTSKSKSCQEFLGAEMSLFTAGGEEKMVFLTLENFLRLRR